MQLPSQSYIKKETKQQYSLNDEEIERFKISALKKFSKKDEYITRNSLSLLLILNLGLRAGEAISLEWTDIDFDNKLMYINKTLQCGIKNENKNENENAYISRIKNNPKKHAI